MLASLWDSAREALSPKVHHDAVVMCNPHGGSSPEASRALW
jgi:hypothetical protein